MVKYQPINGLEDCVERCVGTRYNYWDRPFDHRNLSVCQSLPTNAVEYIPDNPINFIDNSKSWLSNIIAIHNKYDVWLVLVDERSES